MSTTVMAHWDDYDEGERQRMAEARLDLVRDMLDAEHEGWGR